MGARAEGTVLLSPPPPRGTCLYAPHLIFFLTLACAGVIVSGGRDGCLCVWDLRYRPKSCGKHTNVTYHDTTTPHPITDPLNPVYKVLYKLSNCSLVTKPWSSFYS